ncbi:poly [ADP-ribose] polymerase tankyrase-2-like isoform X3 [Oncorhynchus nerka]|nr:poly [ADP-ribose] polymerase tankyrase-2-like isoform X2 [Oncorhynchus nerka]
MVFHGLPFVKAIIHKGFDEGHTYIGGHVWSRQSTLRRTRGRVNQYVYGIGEGTGCPLHKDGSCYVCRRHLLFSAIKLAHSPPGHHSVTGRPSVNGLALSEYVIYRGEQACQEFLSPVRCLCGWITVVPRREAQQLNCKVEPLSLFLLCSVQQQLY